MRRSRALWDEARRPNAPRMALLQAILYELQPVRFSTIDLLYPTRTLGGIWSGFVSFISKALPSIVRETYRLVRNSRPRHWMVVLAAVSYYYLVRYVHQILDAGPLLVIATAIVAILTVGLGDTATRDGMSAYSVFNRGFQRMLGELDSEALVQQHVGGAMGFVGMGVMAQPHAVQHEEPAAAARAEPQNGDAGDNVARAQEEDAPPERGTARKSGKKLRRRDLEQRRELQRQREMATVMGFGGEEGHEEMVAMQRLLEQEIAANNQ